MKAVIAAALRTPIGSFLGALKDIATVDPGIAASRTGCYRR